jgi:type IX secretion system PorP/SprF family membrane protein
MRDRKYLKSALLVLMLFLGGQVFGQYVPQYSLYMLNRYQFNPAFAGMESSLSINGVYRAQWVDLPGNPVQQNLNAHMPVYVLHGAMGISIDHETIGAETTLKGRISYNYVQESKVGLFSAGIALGFNQKSLDGAALRAPDGQYEGTIIIHNDANLPEALVRGMAPEVSAGVYYAGDYFEAGIGLTDWTIGDINMPGATFRGKPAINFFGEYFIESLPQFNIYPTILVRSDFSQLQFEGGVRGVYDDFLMLGMGFRGYSGNTIDALTVFMGLKISPHLSIAYGFDVTLSALSQVSSGSHEIVMRYNLNKLVGIGLPPPAIYSPRFY